MHYNAATVSALLVRALMKHLELREAEELVHKQFPEIDRHTLWESYNIALVTLAVGSKPESIRSGH